MVSPGSNTFSFPHDEESMEKKLGSKDFKMQAFIDETAFGESYRQEIKDSLNKYEIDDTERWRGIKSMEPEEIQQTKEFKKFKDKLIAKKKKEDELLAEKKKE